ncbi:MAG: hypothetical protein Q9170_001960 [Blastenia crenularia]
MDYLCELPNDASRRKELGNLPKTLHATYERILRRVNASNKYVQLLVSRTLRWIIHHESGRSLSTEALSEAISVGVGDTKRDGGSISDEHEILLWCSSLVRKSTDGNSLELAHFTVKEFLQQIGDNDAGEFALYRIRRGYDEVELAKVYLTYLNFQDFDEGGRAEQEVTRRRMEQYPLRKHAITNWPDLARDHLDETELFLFIQRLLNPSKPGTFISWVQDLFIEDDAFMRDRPPEEVDSIIAGASPLHFAALLALPEVCAWLIEGGCDVNRNSELGSPLYCTTAAPNLPDSLIDQWSTTLRQSVASILLEAGADVNYYHASSRASLLFTSLEIGCPGLAEEFLNNGAMLDEPSLAHLEGLLTEDDDEYLRSIVEEITLENVQEEFRPRVLELSLKISESGGPDLFGGIAPNGETAYLRSTDHQTLLRTASQFGRMQAVTQLLGTPNIDLQAAEKETGLTALHFAAMGDNLEIAKVLWNRGAQCSKTDSKGRTAVHHAAKDSSAVLDFFLGQGIEDVPADNEGLTLWHHAACAQNTTSLDILSRRFTPSPFLKEVKTSEGWSPLLCAASNGSTECIDWLLQAGCIVSGTAKNESTALHLASQYASSRSVQLLLDRGSNVNAVTQDGSTALHNALLELEEGSEAIVDLLVRRGADLSKAREDGIMPIHLLMAHSIDGIFFSKQDIRTLTSLILNGNSTTLSKIIQSRQMAFDITKTILQIFLAHNMDFGSLNSRGKAVLQSLVDAWQFSCSRKKPSISLTPMIRMVLEKIALVGPLRKMISAPELIITALLTEDEEVVYGLLEHSPDVDARSGGSSVITTACKTGCSTTLFNQLLMRSSSVSTEMKPPGLVRLACGAKVSRSCGMIDILLNKGFNANDQCPVSGQSSLMVAAWHGNVGAVNLLISYEADTSAVDKDGLCVIHYACVGNHQEILHVLRAVQVDWNRRGVFTFASQRKSGVSPFHIAATLEDIGILEYFIDEGLVSDIDMTTQDSDTALSLATWFKRSRNIASLLSRNADPTIRSARDGECPIHLATRLGYKTIVSSILQYQCDTAIRNASGLSCELIALKYGHQDIVDMLRKYSEGQGQNRKTATQPRESKQQPTLSEALRIAIALADTDLCRRLIDDGANLTLGLEECQGCAPILYALSDGPINEAQLKVVELLAKKGPSIRDTACGLKGPTRGFTTLHYAAAYGYFHLLQILLDKDPMMIFQLRTSLHPFHLAVISGHCDCVELIATHYRKFTTHFGSPSSGHPLNATSTFELVEMQVTESPEQQLTGIKGKIWIPENVHSLRPLHIAAYYGHAKIARFLLECGASVIATDDYYRSALHLAAKAVEHPKSVIKLLLNHGANLQAIDHMLRTPLMYATTRDRLDVLQLLITHGADIQVQDFWGWTAFHLAALLRSIPMIQALVVGAGDHNLGCEDTQGLSPLAKLLARATRNVILFTINLAPSPAAYEPQAGSILAYAIQNPNMTRSLLKKLLRRLSAPLVARLLKHQSKPFGTPLYAACTVAPRIRQEDFINVFLQAGADVEQEGGRHGTPLMGACAAGRIAAVKLLVSRGAQVSYKRDGISISALDAAKHFPEINRWLLVERYTMGPRSLCWR